MIPVDAVEIFVSNEDGSVVIGEVDLIVVLEVGEGALLDVSRVEKPETEMSVIGRHVVHGVGDREQQNETHIHKPTLPERILLL
jgi:hypothetical protein